MNNAAKKLLFDVLESARSIRDWCTERTFADYESDRQFRRAVEREFEIIGEALGRLSIADAVLAGLNVLLAQGFVLGFALAQIFINLVLMGEVKRESAMDVFQREHGKVIYDAFWRQSSAPGADH